MESDFISDLQNELKDFQTTIMLSAENMITKKMKALTIAMQQSFQDRVAQAMEQALQKKQCNEINANHSTILYLPNIEHNKRSRPSIQYKWNKQHHDHLSQQPKKEELEWKNEQHYK